MKLRVLTAVVGIPLLLAFVYFDFEAETDWFSRVPLFILPVAAAAALGAWEFYRLGTHAGARPLTVFGVIWAVLFVVAALFNGEWASSREAASYADWAVASLLATAAVLPSDLAHHLSPGHLAAELGLDPHRHPLHGLDGGPLRHAEAA